MTPHCTCPGVEVASVSSASDGGASVQLADGSSVSAARGVIVAADGPAACRLLGDALGGNPSKADPGVGTSCTYFACAPPAPHCCPAHCRTHAATGDVPLKLWNML